MKMGGLVEAALGLALSMKWDGNDYHPIERIVFLKALAQQSC